jgi:uncharacterized BrkB/YihY/UPF0761 family membrane protein
MQPADRTAKVGADVTESADNGQPPAGPAGEAPPKETLVQRGKRWSKASMAWAVDASERHLSVAMGFRAAQQNRRVAAAVLAGGFAYRLFFWLLALGLVGGGVLGFFQEDSLEEALGKAGIPGAVIRSVGHFAADSGSARWWLIIVGVYLLLWSGYSGSKAARLVHALIWDEPPGKLARPFQASLAFSAVCLGLAGSIGLSWWLKEHVAAGAIAAVVALVVPLTALWLWVSNALPHRGVDWKDLLPGSVLVAVGFQILHVLTMWLAIPKLQSSTSTYGPLGVVAVLLFWGYLIGRLVVTAPILNASLYDERRRKRGDETVAAVSLTDLGVALPDAQEPGHE